MSRQYCFLCASDEGVFLDVTPDNLTVFSDQIETCLPTKINECINLSNKICYKCAYELDQCTKFVQKYKKPQEISEAKDNPLMSCCSLCYESVDNDHIFDITKDNSSFIFNPLQKIRSIFNNDVIKKTSDIKLICLTCRYNLDILYDLRKIYQETIGSLKDLVNEKINYSKFPKVHTDVVNRKTTITTFPDITFCGSVNSSDSDTNENNMERSKRRVKRRKTLNKPNAGIKLQSNKSKEDPSSNKTRRSRAQSNLAGTKLCTVFLTDVLNQKSHTKKKTQKIKKDIDDNTLYDSLQEETKSSGSNVLGDSSNTKNDIINGKTRLKRKRQIDTKESKNDTIESKPTKMTRSNKEYVKTPEVKSTEISTDVKQQFGTPSTKKGQKRMMGDKNSDSDSSDQKGAYKSKDHINQTHKKKRKVFDGIKMNLDSSEDTSNEESKNLRSKIKGTSSSLLTSRKVKEEAVAVGRNSSRTRSSSVSSTEVASSTDVKNPKSVAQSEGKTEYSCDICRKKFDTKVSNAEHKLTHLKQAALMLKKLTISSIKEVTEVDSQDDKVYKEEESLPDKHTDEPMEEFSISIEDTDDEETLSVSTNEKRKNVKVRRLSSNENDNVNDKKDTTKNESRVEESANVEDIKTKEFKQCEKLTTIKDGTVTLDIKNNDHKEDDTDEKDKDTMAEHTTEDRDKTSPNKESDEFKDTDGQKIVPATEDCNQNEKDKNVQIESSAEVTFIKNTITKSNDKEGSDKEENDKMESDEEENDRERTTLDREINKSLNHNVAKDIKDQSESCNNLENKFDDDKIKVIEKPEISQCDLVDDLSRNDVKEPEKNKKTKILNDKRQINDITINEHRDKELENLQNEVDEEDLEKMEVEADIHESDGTKGAINSDFDEFASTKDTINSNGEKHDEIKNGDEDVSVPANSNDAKSIKIKGKETDDSKEKQKFEKEMKELEELVNDNAGSKEKRIQENCSALDNNSVDAANEILKEVFELAAAEVQNREKNNTKSLDIEMETLENISHEIRKSADMPSLDPINVMEMDDGDITLE
ncbi:hypothetical protein PUN28_019660 [Cardiocondyla obscurior]|uniref:C2H2-type domain-containing protein n=1 Tax=Cardiocondyla obscurior TaxID=286306 RepID=A0AAW2EE16_9HYME